MTTEGVAEPGGRRQSDRKVRTLLVDDEDDIRYLVQMFLEKAPDFQVVGVAVDGAQGVGLARELQPDLVLLDVLMPKMSGIQAAPLVQQVAPKAKVVFLTVLTEPVLDAIAVGEKVAEVPKVDGVIMKLELSTLVPRLREVISG